MALRDEMIMEKAALEAELADTSAQDGFFQRRRRTHGRRSHLGYKLRMLMFICLVGAFLLTYVLSFVNGGTWGSSANKFTDYLMTAFVDFITGSFASSSELLANRADTISRVLTFGPLSYIIISTIISAVIVGLFAFGYSRYKTRRAVENGTSNLVMEKSVESKKKPPWPIKSSSKPRKKRRKRSNS